MLSNLLDTQIRLKSPHQLQFLGNDDTCLGGWWSVSLNLKVNNLLLKVKNLLLSDRWRGVLGGNMPKPLSVHVQY